jgi:hypothetical protein
VFSGQSDMGISHRISMKLEPPGESYFESKVPHIRSAIVCRAFKNLTSDHLLTSLPTFSAFIAVRVVVVK